MHPFKHCLVRPRQALMLGLALCFSIIARSALAQGTSGTLPEPITASEMSRYADRLQLSPQQRQAADSFHEQYKIEFRALRETEISAFLKNMRELNQGGMMPQRDAVEKFMRQMDQLNRRIEQIDSRLFDQMQSVLTPEQLAQMPRVRQARQRQRYMGQQFISMGGQGVGVDLSQMVFEMDLNAADMQAVDPALATYETKLTQGMSKFYDSVRSMMMDMFDAMEKAGFSETSMEDPEVQQKMGEIMQQVWKDISKKVMENAAVVTELNRKSARSIASLLPEASGRKLLHTYWQKAFPEAGLSFANLDAAFDAALKLEELTDEQKQAIATLQSESYRRLDQQAEQFVDYLDEFRKNRSPFDAAMGNWQEHQEKLTDFHQKFAAAGEAARDALREALGPELVEKIPGSILSKTKSPVKATPDITTDVEPDDDQAVAATSGFAIAGGEGMAELAHGPDTFLPAAITSREMNEYSAMLNLTEEQSAVLEGLYENYNERFSQVMQEEVARLTKAQQSLWKYDQQTGASTTPTEAQIDEVYRLREGALAAVQRIDEQFFADIEAALLTEEQKPAMPGVRQSRQRVVYNRGTDSFAMMGGSSEAAIDLARLIRNQRLEKTHAAAVLPILGQYEQLAAEGFKNKYQAALTVQRTQDKWNAQMMKAQQEGGNAMQYAMRYREVLAEPHRQMRNASEALAKINRETLQQLVSAIPAEEAHKLQDTYNRRAFPSIYNDPIAVHNQIDMALRLLDVTDDQRTRINDLAANYRMNYATLSENMVRESIGGLSIGMGMAFEPEDWQKWQERQDAMSKLAFDRNELSLKTLRQLKTALNESQVERLGGLPEPKVQEGHKWY